MTDTTDNTRFEFGKNWESYSELVDEERVESATRRLSGMLGMNSLENKRFLDIGCGSGLHSLAALRLGASHLTAVDLDPISVSTMNTLLEKFGLGERARAVVRSVFDLDPEKDGLFDIVYSWGVLHHTGKMNAAILTAARLVEPGGIFAVALYGKTRYCGIWTRIKRWYVSAPSEKKEWAEKLYVRLFGYYLLLRGKRLSTHILQYQHNKRGMDFLHDVRDWIGGYPYESIRPEELDQLLEPLGFHREKCKVKRRSGLFGSGCDEYVYRRTSAR